MKTFLFTCDSIPCDAQSTFSIEEIKRLSGILPGWIHLNHKEDFSFAYISSNMQEALGLDGNASYFNGYELLTTYVHDESLERIEKYLKEFKSGENAGKTFSFYQYISIPGKRYAWYYTTCKNYNKELLISNTLPVTLMKDFDGHVLQLLNENMFIKSTLEKYKSLTGREAEVIKHLIMGKTNMQISALLNVSALTVKTHRRNIYKKLAITNICELMTFASIYNIG